MRQVVDGACGVSFTFRGRRRSLVTEDPWRVLDLTTDLYEMGVGAVAIYDLSTYSILWSWEKET